MEERSTKRERLRRRLSGQGTTKPQVPPSKERRTGMETPTEGSRAGGAILLTRGAPTILGGASTKYLEQARCDLRKEKGNEVESKGEWWMVEPATTNADDRAYAKRLLAVKFVSPKDKWAEPPMCYQCRQFGHVRGRCLLGKVCFYAETRESTMS